MLDMGLISKKHFENQVTAHLNRIEPGLAAVVQRKTGNAWRPIIDKLYRDRASNLTFANTAQVLTWISQTPSVYAAV